MSDFKNINLNKNLEFLFYGVDPEYPEEIYRILEEGYRNSEVLFHFKFNNFKRNVKK
jgi:hypothetical protein